MRQSNQSKLVLPSRGAIYDLSSKLAHIAARDSNMSHKRPQAMHKDERTVLLILYLIQMPATLICYGVLVKFFRSRESSLSYSDRCLSESSKDFSKVNVPEFQPLLDLGSSRELNFARSLQTAIG